MSAFREAAELPDDDRGEPMAHVWARCPSHPNDMGTHECMVGEVRCVYCAVPLHPIKCNGCGKFMSLAEVEKYESRCAECA